MLSIIVPGGEFFNEKTLEFVYTDPVELRMEHSLISISKWEAKYHKAYLNNKERTPEETLYYFKCMTLNKVDPKVYDRLSSENITKIFEYINEPMTAYHGVPSFVNNATKGGSKDVMISELIYYYMITLGIPFECEKWHFNKLMALIEVCTIKNSSGKKTMSRGDLNRRNAALNKKRRAARHSKG